MKKVLSVILVCVVVFWAGRIYSINQSSPVTTFYNIGDAVDCGDLELYMVESHLDDLDEFNDRFKTDYSYGSDGECKYISICIDVTNTSDSDIHWDQIFGFLTKGFESQGWGSEVDINIMSKINVFNDDFLNSGSSQKIWFVTTVNKVCYKERSWVNIYDRPFFYVLSPAPHKTVVRLDT